MKRDKFVKRTKGHAAERLRNDPAFEGTRKHWQEFATANQAALLMRQVMESIITPARNRNRYSTLVQLMMRVIKKDPQNIPGQRQLLHSNLRLLKEVEFNYGIPFRDIFKVSYTTNVSRQTGNLQITFPSFVPAKKILSPTAATHAKITIAAAAVDFKGNKFTRKWDATDFIPLDNIPTGKMTTTIKLNGGKHPLILFLHLAFFNNGYKLEQEMISIVEVDII